MKLNIFAIIVLLFINGCNTSNLDTVEDASQEDIISDKKEGTATEVIIIDKEDTGTEDIIPLVKKTSNWYMKTIVDATLPNGTIYSYRKGGVFGELQGSNDQNDEYDVLSYGTKVLHVVFPHAEWEEEGDYVSDYHSIKEDGEKRAWTFQVKNQSNAINLSNASLNISLDGPYDIDVVTNNGYSRFKEKLSEDDSRKTSITLVDVDNQTAYSYAQLTTAYLSMDGLKTRTFRWVVGSVDGGDYEAISSMQTSAAKSSVSSRSLKSSIAADSDDKFGPPPSF